MAEVIINESNFEAEVLNSEVPVLVDMWATWCGPCRMLAPIIKEIAEEHPEIKVAKIDVDENQELAVRYGVSSIPTLLVFKNGRVVNKSIGVMPKARVLDLLK